MSQPPVARSPRLAQIKPTGGAPRRILVTGGAGFIGSHACKALAAAGFEPVAFDNLSRGHADAVRWGPLVKGSVGDAEAVADALTRYDILAVMHFAAKAYVGESVTSPWSYYGNNVCGIIGLLEGCKRAGVFTFVFSSSCAVYGVPPRLPITEDTLPEPVNPYGRTKLMGEQMLLDYASAGATYNADCRYVALRYFNVAGADPDGELGERHDPETHLVPLALLAANGRHPALEIFGTDYDTPDGTCVRDYIHVSDLARAHVLALQHLLDGGPSTTLNLGSGRGYSVREVVDAVARVTGRTPPVVDRPRRAGDPPMLVADPAKAREVLGFVTERSELDRMVADAAPWFAADQTDARSA